MVRKAARGTPLWAMSLACLLFAGCTAADEASPEGLEVELGSQESRQRVRAAYERDATVAMPEDADLGIQAAAAMGALNQMSSMMELEVQQMRELAANGAVNMTETDLAAMERAGNRLISEHGETLLAAFGDVYQRVYSEEELRAIIDFFSSPEGRATLQKQGEVSAAGLNIGAEVVAPLMQTLMQEEFARGEAVAMPEEGEATALPEDLAVEAAPDE